MKKAMMYLLLALGISLGVVFVGGAVISFSAGFIDGFNDGYDGAAPGSTDSKKMILSSGMVLVLLTCVILNIVFLRLRYASYTVGRIPKEKRWQVIAWLVLAMAGLTMVYSMMYNPLVDSDEAVRTSYAWMKEHPVISVLLCVIVEATASPEGGEEFNKQLSEERAYEVARYLKERGVNVVKYTGLGATGADSQRIARVTIK